MTHDELRERVRYVEFYDDRRMKWCIGIEEVIAAGLDIEEMKRLGWESDFYEPMLVYSGKKA